MGGMDRQNGLEFLEGYTRVTPRWVELSGQTHDPVGLGRTGEGENGGRPNRRG